MQKKVFILGRSYNVSGLKEDVLEGGVDLRVDLFLVFGYLVVVAAVVHFFRNMSYAAHTVAFGDVQSVQDRYGIMTEFVRRYGRIYSDLLFRRDKVTRKFLCGHCNNIFVIGSVRF